MVLIEKEPKSVYVGSTAVKSIRLGSTQVRPSRWQPGANTVAYYPLTSSSTVNDLSGNSRNLTQSSVTFGTYHGVDCAYSNGRYKGLVSPTITFPKTLSFWTYWEGTFGAGGSTYAPLYTYGNGSTYKSLVFNEKNGDFNIDIGGSSVGISQTSGQRFNCVIVNDGDLKVYKNGVLVGTAQEGTLSDYAFYFFSFSTNPNGIDVYFGGLSNVIMESVGRSASEILDYYNQTKSNYGIS